MKTTKKILAIVMVLAILSLAACSKSPASSSSTTQSSNATPSSQAEPAPPPSSSSDASSDDDQPEIPESEAEGETDATSADGVAEYRLLALDVIEKYKSNSLKVSDDFPELPADFEFPEDLSGLEFEQSEMGGIYTIITDKSGKYEMGIAIDNSIYDGEKAEGSSRVSGVMFNKIA